MLQILVRPTTAFMQNTRLILDHEHKAAVLCDPGAHDSEVGNFIRDNDYTLKAILVTHGHLDHVGGVAAYEKAFPGTPVIGPAREDADLLHSLPVQAQAFGLPEAESFTPQYVTDGQKLELFEGRPFEVLFTPGHTPGGVCYYQAEEGFVLCGDTLFAGSVGRTDFPGGDFAAIEESIRCKLYALPDATRVLSGHGPDSTIGEEKRSNAFVRA